MVVMISSGLGNQMFQYAFAKVLSLKLKEKVQLDTTPYGNISKSSPNKIIVSKEDQKNMRNFELMFFNIALDILNQNDMKQFFIKNDVFFYFIMVSNKRFCKILRTLIPKRYRYKIETYKYFITENNKLLEKINTASEAVTMGGGGKPCSIKTPTFVVILSIYTILMSLGTFYCKILR